MQLPLPCLQLVMNASLLYQQQPQHRGVCMQTGSWTCRCRSHLPSATNQNGLRSKNAVSVSRHDAQEFLGTRLYQRLSLSEQ